MTTIDKEKLGEMYSDIKWLKKAFEAMDDKFARKWTERIMVGALSTVLIAVAGALLGLVLIPQTTKAFSYLITLT